MGTKNRTREDGGSAKGSLGNLGNLGNLGIILKLTKLP